METTYQEEIVLRLPQHTYDVHVTANSDADVALIRTTVHQRKFDEPRQVAQEVLNIAGVRVVEVWKNSTLGFRLTKL